MLELAVPHRRFHRSFLAAADEFLAAGEGRYAHLLDWPADDTFPGLSVTRESLESPQAFEEYAAFLVAQAERDAPRPAHFVPMTDLWMADGDTYLGRISVRHRLTDVLRTWGGHIGYAVRPSARGHGYARQALTAALPVCARLGLDPVLVTCDPDNHASRLTIERCGGVYEDTREGKRRYWIATAARRRRRIRTGG
ncbi:MAG TPA: GNAT family N-acetyltransferase [Nocardioidaceae bacterium]|nr:GNAT family N-acetyltransferase [Nocardioidaceae bacterium]